MTAGLLLAAGRGRRFGGEKQMADLAGRPLYEWSLRTALDSRRLDRVLVAVAPGSPVADGATALGAEVLEVPDAEEGIAAGLRSGVGALSAADGILVLLADQPLIADGSIAKVLEAGTRASRAARAVYAGKPSHPVLLLPPIFAAVCRLAGDRGAGELLRGEGVIEVECGGLGSSLDVDTPADLERAARLLG